MDDIFIGLIQLLKTNPFFFGVCGFIISILLIIGLSYLFLKRNEVMTLTYGLTLISVFIFLLFCIVALLLASIFGVTAGKMNNSSNLIKKSLL